MRQGNSDREIAPSGLMARPKSSAVRVVALDLGWLDSTVPSPDDETLASVLSSGPRATTCVSTLTA